MSIAVAHQHSATGKLVLTTGAREARLRGTDLVVINIVEALDLDSRAALQAGLSDEIEADAELLVIGARQRSTLGKFLMGSATQTIILDVPMPVLVVKA